MSDKKVVIVEDDQDLLETMGLVLKDEGYRVWKFTNAKSAQRKLTEIAPDTLIVDLMLPGIGGDQLVTYVKAHDKLKTANVILISADERVAKVALESGADSYLKKPFAFERLVNLT